MSENFQTIKDIRGYLLKELISIYPEKEIIAITNHIFMTQFGINRLQVIANPERSIESFQPEIIREICTELKTGKPIQYILGETIFYECHLKVNNKTLIPRPETEELVDLIIKDNKEFRGRIIDFGTGSGCIAIALMKNMPFAEVTGIDISDRAIELAESNAKLNNVNVRFIKGNVFQFDPAIFQKTDIVVSNPPYVLESEKKYMNRNVIDFEPAEALFVTDHDPLIFYSAIVRITQKLLSPGGRIYFEINEKKGVEISNLLNNAGFRDVQIINDLNGKNRFVKGIYS
jgi:release factor glutamine methyltransferase